MYINHWDYEHQSYEPCSIANPLEDISAIIHESNANETYMNFQAQQHHEFDIPIWSNEFSMPTTTDSPFLYCQGCKDNYSENITKQDQPTTCFKLGSESLMSSSEDSISSCEKCSEFPSCSDKRVLESDFSPDHKSHEISFQKTQVNFFFLTSFLSYYSSNLYVASFCLIKPFLISHWMNLGTHLSRYRSVRILNMI